MSVKQLISPLAYNIGEIVDSHLNNVRKNSIVYLDEFVKLKCAPDLLAWKVFPNAKEITESMAAYGAVRKHFHRLLSSEETLGVFVGDGQTPRTGALFAYRTPWTCHSVDPDLEKKKDKFNHIERLTIFPIKFDKYLEQMEFSIYKHIIFICVHSHAKLDNLLNILDSKCSPSVYKNIIAIPCCVEQSLGKENPPNITYSDSKICSPCRTVYIWNK